MGNVLGEAGQKNAGREPGDQQPPPPRGHPAQEAQSVVAARAA